jgi:hypothetical protein
VSSQTLQSHDCLFQLVALTAQFVQNLVNVHVTFPFGHVINRPFISYNYSTICIVSYLDPSPAVRSDIRIPGT